MSENARNAPNRAKNATFSDQFQQNSEGSINGAATLPNQRQISQSERCGQTAFLVEVETARNAFWNALWVGADERHFWTENDKGEK